MTQPSETMTVPKTFKAVTVNQDISINIEEVDMPQPTGDQLLVRIIASGVNPKDWKVPAWGFDKNSGDDMAGYVVAVGPDVTEFHVGDRVAGFHVMAAPYGSFGEYGIVNDYLAFHLSPKTTFQEASTIPLAAITAALGLFSDLELPTPWNPAPEGSSNPLVIWGGSGAVGSFAIKLAKAANISPIIAIAGAGAPYVKSLGVDKIIDYRNDDVTTPLREFLGDQKVYNLLDGIGGSELWKRIGESGIVEEHGSVASAMCHDIKEMQELLPGLNVHATACSKVQRGRKEAIGGGAIWATNEHFGYVMTRSIGKLLAEGKLKGHPVQTFEGQKEIETALKDLKDGKASAVKYVINIGKE